MDYGLIQSDSNPKFKRWRKLAENARFIKKEKATLAEGAHLLLTMAERGITPAALLLRSGGISDEVGDVVENYAREGVPCYVLDNRLYDMISPVEHGAGIMAEVAIIERARFLLHKKRMCFIWTASRIRAMSVRLFAAPLQRESKPLPPIEKRQLYGHLRRFAPVWELILQRLFMKMLNRGSLPVRLMLSV